MFPCETVKSEPGGGAAKQFGFKVYLLNYPNIGM